MAGKSPKKAGRKKAAKQTSERSTAKPPTRVKAGKDSRQAKTTVNSGGSPVNSHFPVVVMIASAGGLDAFKQFLAAMPDDNNIGFIVIPHLHPSHASQMAELLAKGTRMPVTEVGDRMKIRADHVYVIPPKKDLAVVDGRLKLSEPQDPGRFQSTVDFCLQSLAADRKERAIAIIMSGTGSFRTLGLKEIKIAGGMVIAQAPESAEFDQMPRAAIASGFADYILAPEEMPAVLMRYAKHSYLSNINHTSEPSGVADENISQVLAVLLAKTRYDFRCYRKSMLLRRIHRRMGLLHLDGIHEYVERLQSDGKEVADLNKDLLICVTAFFREPEAFKVLATNILPLLVLKASVDAPIRVWVPGCATGEEAYSIAILLLEQFALANKVPSIQIYATDIGDGSLDIARQGIYPTSISSDVTTKRLRQFFIHLDEHHYQVSRQLRECVVFAPQDLLSDAPFSGLNMVSCRNVLIYLEPEVQTKVISLFHFSLLEGGYLLLGPSETVGDAADMFETVSKKWRVFRRIGPERRRLLEIPILAPKFRRPRYQAPILPKRQAVGASELMQRAVLDKFAPASALINRKYQILSVQGPLADYLEFPPGEFTRDLLPMVRHGLRTRVRAACNLAMRDGEPVSEVARVRRNGAYENCTVTVHPLVEPAEAAGLLLIAFHERSNSTSSQASVSADESNFIGQLEDELRTSHAEMQGMIEELESSNEELKSTNEEIMSMNEELQSANEELETSKEEMQSMNEELSTINVQIKEKMDELAAANNDIQNLLSSSDIAVVFLDTNLRIKLFTSQAAKLLNLIATDVGRPLGDIAPNFVDPTLIEDCRTVLDQLAPEEKEIVAADGAYYLRRILTYRTADNRIEGIVIAFVDITGRVAAETQTRRLATVLMDSNDAVAVQSTNGNIIAWNRGAERMYGYTETEALNMTTQDFVPPDKWDEERDYFDRVGRGEKHEAWETQRVTRDGRILDVWLTATRLEGEGDEAFVIATTERDITRRKQAEVEAQQYSASLERHVAERSAALQESESRIRAIVEAAPDAIITIDAQGTMSTINRATENMFGYTAGELIGQNITMLLPIRNGVPQELLLHRYQETGEPEIDGRTRELTAHRKDGHHFPVELSIGASENRGLFTAIIHDISDRKALQTEILNIANLEQRRIGQELHDGTQQELIGLALLAQNLSDSLEQGEVGEKQLAQKLASGIASANLRVKELARGLVPVPVDAEGLMSALATLAANTIDNHGLSCDFRCPSPVSVGNDTVATHLYCIAKEAVLNAVKHAEADAIEISLRSVRDSIKVEVRDNGIGIDKDHDASQSLGLRIMGYRCSLIGGSFNLGRTNDGGTSVTCTVPKTAIE